VDVCAVGAEDEGGENGVYVYDCDYVGCKGGFDFLYVYVEGRDGVI
jgi:hypothetical protein